jgi:hypothetical protein
MHSSILRRIWLNFKAQYLFFRLFYSFHNISDFNLFGLSTTDETLLVEMRIWCIKIGIVLVLHWYLVHCFAIPRYRLSWNLVLVHWFFTKLWPLDLEITNYQFSGLFLSLLTDIHLIFGTLFCHTKLQIKFKFGFLSIWN